MHPLSKKNAIAFSAFHVVATVSLFFFSWRVFFLVLILLTVNLCFGIGASFHRHLVHRGYSTPKWFEYTLATCGYFALQSSAISWVAIHREHHKLSDKEGDPHSPRDGVWWAHMDWMLHPNPIHKTPGYLMRWAPELYSDRYYSFLHPRPWLPLVVLGVILAFLVGLVPTLNAVTVAIVLGWHWTWLVNSATHMWGYRTYNTPDNSHNSLWVALLTFGEGNHNNHHAHPSSARHGEKWFEWDPTYRLIWLLSMVSYILPRPAKLVWGVTVWKPLTA